jgi:NADPH-dependent 2,4-dienoyl-CoA reductase/sulfur reductase-like enzyme/rhodanese-related sulfurtransferase
MKIVVVGGVAGGASAAVRARRLDENADIVLLERGRYVSFANCGLPYYVGNEIQQREKLIVTQPERLKERFRIDVRTQNNVELIDRTERKVIVKDLSTGKTYKESYDKLILSPGASPIVPSFAGKDSRNVYSLRTLEDVDRIRSLVDQGIASAMVVGAGFIGLEMVENLVRRGVKTTLVQLSDQILSALDPEMTSPLLGALKQNGVELILNQTVSEVSEGDDGKLQVVLTGGGRIKTDLLLVGVGVTPESNLARVAGLAIGPRGGIVTNQYMQSNDPDIYAVGDAVEVEDFVSKVKTQIPLAGPANRQGRIAADHIFGKEASYRGTQGTAIVRLFDVVATTTGANERTLQRLEIPFEKIYIHPGNHASYYPGAQGMSVKLLFDKKNGLILGAQIVGGEGVDKRIDVIAVAIQAGMTVLDLEQVELAYSPQFGSAKDPINMAGFVASNVLQGLHPIVHTGDLSKLMEQGRVVLDVRTESEYQAGHIPNALHIPIDELRDRLEELPKDRELICYCQVGQRGYLATRILVQNGYQVANLSGGYKTYKLFHPAG